ncbi:MAG: hypothetical protein WBE27_01605 [Microgenomates group bacterium]
MKELEPFSPAQLRKIIYQRISASGEPTEYGRNLDWWFFSIDDEPVLEHGDILPLNNVSSKVDELLKQNYALAYWSGGFDLGMPHRIAISGLRFIIPDNVRIVMGIEPDSYFKSKGRNPEFPQKIRLSAVAQLLKQNEILGIAFPIPDRPKRDISTNTFYEWLVRKIGMCRRGNCYHLYSEIDPARDIKIKRMLNPQTWCELPDYGRLSTSEVLTMK